MRTIKTYSNRVPFYNALIKTYKARKNLAAFYEAKALGPYSEAAFTPGRRFFRNLI